MLTNYIYCKITIYMCQDSTTKEIVREIMKRLVYNYFTEEDVIESYFNNIELAWEDFIDDQQLGDCENICDLNLLSDIPNIEVIYGLIEVDYPIYDEILEYDNESGDYFENESKVYYLPHYWIKVNGDTFEFSKGTLADYIDWDDIYGVETENTERYKEFV